MSKKSFYKKVFVLVGVLFGLVLQANSFDPNSVPCALDSKDFKKMYIGTLGDYEWKKGLSQISKSTGYYDTKRVNPKGKNSCQIKLKQHQCLTMFLDENWEKKFGTNSGEFSCVNLRTGEVVPPTDIAYTSSVQERMIKMRCPNKNGISECSNDSNSKRGNDFRKDVLNKNKWEMESVCAGYIRTPRYFKQGKVGDTALCALTNKKGEALYKVLIPMEYEHAQPLKKLDGKTVSYRPAKKEFNINDKKSMDSIFMNSTSLNSMAGTMPELVAIATRCSSQMYLALEQSGGTSQQIEDSKKTALKALSSWSDTTSIVLPGKSSQSSMEKLEVLANYHYKNHAKKAALKNDMKSCIPLYQRVGLY